jgi:hypothetical protein
VRRAPVLDRLLPSPVGLVSRSEDLRTPGFASCFAVAITPHEEPFIGPWVMGVEARVTRDQCPRDKHPGCWHASCRHPALYFPRTLAYGSQACRQGTARRESRGPAP